MQSTHFLKASILTLILAASFILCLEWYWRSQGFTPTFNDDKVLWATKRKELDKLADHATVFVGGSRIKFDLDIPTWERLTGEKSIQLAIVGTPGRLVLRHLARNEKFKGKLILDVAEGQFFSFIDSIRVDKSAREAIEYFNNETPAQRASASINYFLESRLVLLEEGKFSLTPLLSDLMVPNRPGVFVRPPFPKEFSIASLDRQNSMTSMFVKDPRLQKRQIDIWMGLPKLPPVKGDTLTAFLEETKAAIDKIRSRGGIVIFVRPPSSGGVLASEKVRYPRQQYWDRLLEYTNTPGIHYADYPATANLACPEWSHLSPKDAVIYTTQLVKILENEKGWTFSNKAKLTAHNLKR
jgi:hypothetical protein